MKLLGVMNKKKLCSVANFALIIFELGTKTEYHEIEKECTRKITWNKNQIEATWSSDRIYELHWRCWYLLCFRVLVELYYIWFFVFFDALITWEHQKQLQSTSTLYKFLIQVFIYCFFFASLFFRERVTECEVYQWNWFQMRIDDTVIIM